MRLTRHLVVSVLLAAPSAAQSILLTAQVFTPVSVQALDPSAPYAQSTVPSGTPILNGFEANAASSGQTFANTNVFIGQLPAHIRIEETTSSAAGGIALAGGHELLVFLTVTRAYSGDVIVRWNGIQQTDGTGSLSGEVDIGSDGTTEFQAVERQVRTQRFFRAWGPGAPLIIRTRTRAQAGGPAVSAYKGILEIEFAPDSATVRMGSFSPFGFGCAGFGGAAPILIGAIEGPLVGETFVAQISALPVTTTAITGLVGFVETPPVHLGPVGMDLCFLFLEPVFMTPVAVPPPGGTTGLNLPIPNRTDLIGLVFITQAFVRDPATPGLGAVMSNPGRGVVGGR